MTEFIKRSRVEFDILFIINYKNVKRKKCIRYEKTNLSVQKLVLAKNKMKKVLL